MTKNFDNIYLNQTNLMKKKIVSSLIELLNCFETPEEYIDEKRNICLNISKDINLKNFSDYITVISNFIVIIQKKSNEREKSFFKKIELQLKFFYEFLITESSQIIENGIKDLEFHEIFQSKIDSFENDIKDSDSTSDIKSKISNYIFSVNFELLKYKDLKEEQINSFNSKFMTMDKQLQEMKSDYKRMVSSFSSKIEELNIENETDSLTQVKNRQGYGRLINNLYSHYLKNIGNDISSHLNIVMCDIDHFKKINDEHGHDAGDKILSFFSQMIKSELRENDHVCRIGGEEFVIIMTGSSYTNCLKVVERIRDKIANTALYYQDRTINITASFGLSYFNGTDDVPIDVYKRADEALYSSKKNGRNMIYLNDPFEHKGIFSFKELIS